MEGLKEKYGRAKREISILINEKWNSSIKIVDLLMKYFKIRNVHVGL
jgi:hypothetical protein